MGMAAAGGTVGIAAFHLGSVVAGVAEREAILGIALELRGKTVFVVGTRGPSVRGVGQCIERITSTVVRDR